MNYYVLGWSIETSLVSFTWLYPALPKSGPDKVALCLDVYV